MVVDKQAWMEWVSHPVTNKFFKHLEKAREETKELWASGSFKNELDNQFALGGIYSINQILDLEYEDIVGGTE